MKKFSLNLLKVGLLFLLSAIIFFMTSYVEAATLDEGSQELTTGIKKQVVSLSSDQGVFDYYVKDANGNIIEDANTKRGKCEYVNVELSGKSSLYWNSTGTNLTKNVSITITQPGTYTIEIVKAKHVTGTWIAWKGDTLKYTLEVFDPVTISFENETVNLNVGERKETTIIATGFSGMACESENPNVATAGWEDGKFYITAVGVGNTAIKVTATGKNGKDKITATCQVTVVDAEGTETDSKEEPVKTTEENKKEDLAKPKDAKGTEIAVGNYVKYTDNTNEGGWNIRSTAGGAKTGKEIKDGTIVEVIEVSGLHIKVTVVEGDLEGTTGWLWITNAGKGNFEILPDYTPPTADDKADDKVDGSEVLSDINLPEGLNGITNLIKMLLDTILNLIQSIDWVSLAGTAGQIATGFIGTISTMFGN